MIKGSNPFFLLIKQLIMKHLGNFLGKTAQLVIVFTAVFTAPALMLAFLWMNLSIYKACVHSPTYCAIMFALACVGTYGYVLWVADKRQSSKQG
jgi:hypothetical protein